MIISNNYIKLPEGISRKSPYFPYFSNKSPYFSHIFHNQRVSEVADILSVFPTTVA